MTCGSSRSLLVHCSFVILALGLSRMMAQESVCARIVLQIEQELTLEREGFEARLGITNGLPTALENLQVTLHFTDAEGNAVGAATETVPNSSGKFFHRIQTGYADVSSVAASATAKIAYLIVPSAGAAGDSASGKLYYIGATVKYTSAGVEETVLIAPDYIYVRPMPILQLQYFIPGEVYGDDPFTGSIQEPAVPYYLGVRVINHSPFATAKSVKIQSSQPEIIDNQQGLLIAFELLGSRVNGLARIPSLEVDFGDIAAQRSSMASWDMISSLSGRFVRFTAEVSHAEEFGGALTSLIPEDAMSTHRLIGQVMVDLAGRDTLPDFLATDVMVGDISVPKVFESGSGEVSQGVEYFPPGSGAVSVVSSGATANVTIDAASTLLFVRTASPVAADKSVEAVRSDGKILPRENAWISKTQDSSGFWSYTLNLFDTNKAAGQSYALTFVDPALGNQRPVLTVFGGTEFTIAAGQVFTLGMSAMDPDGTLPSLSSLPLPFGAAFVTQLGSSALFTWAPAMNQIGTFALQFKATDGSATDTVNVVVHVVGSTGLRFASWQRSHWPLTDDPLVVGPAANPDRDQMSNLLEYALDSDPTQLDDSALPLVGISTVGGLRYLTLTYRKRVGDPTLVYQAIAANDLSTPAGSWIVLTETEPVLQGDLPIGMERVKVRDSTSIETGAPQRFLKLRVTQEITE